MRALIGVGVILVVTGCATQQVHMQEPRRVVGTEESVRIDAEITGDQVGPNTQIPITYAITNHRDVPIAIADLIPDTAYDSDTQTITVSFGSEVPGESIVPRLITIAPGEQKTFSTVAKMHIALPNLADNPLIRTPNALRVKLNFLGDTKPFKQIVNIPERAVHDPQLADALLPAWLDANEVVYTNTLPMRWQSMAATPPERGGAPATGRRRGRRG
ncbi:MAG TPA: hypothetical protein VFN10_10035 [Thermoanaerobaculia bacterium]|nr:hypothetical protein [Thermoanaerobaculia bacterium]